MDAHPSDRLPRISALQFATMVTAGYLPCGIFYFPRPAIADAGKSGLWCIFLDGGVTWCLMALMFRVTRLVPDESIIAISPKIVGRPLGWFLGVYLIIYHLVLTIAAVSLFGFVMREVFLPHDPIWAIIGALTATAVYMGWGGAVGIARTLMAGYGPVAFFTILTGMVSVILIRHPVLLKPPLFGPLFPILSGAWHEYILFIGFQLTITLYPFIRNEQRLAAQRYTYWGLLMVVTALVIQYEVMMAAFGPSYLIDLRWPLVSFLRIISVESFFIDKFGLLVLALWTMIVVGFTAVRFWCITHGTLALAGWHSTSAYRVTLAVFGSLAVIGAVMIPNATTNEYVIQTYLIPGGLLFLIMTPGILLPMAFFRSGTVRKLRMQYDTPAQE
ncbi:MAG: spore gernimation protein [Sulfobacillus benefaciens]|uniref:Spore gernimation protein n=1 Tax=Sulfobacillus benefaciens TaxID=453960 RepID=A0A2T2XI80_9FIRM|nr:MAG: spore gernimation protein [Sulfobacillus benefaciens]